MTDTTQAVVDTTNPPATPGGADTSARATDNLDDLLAKFDEGTTRKDPPQPSPDPQPPPQPSPSDERMRRIEDRLFRQDFNEVVANVTGDMKIPDRIAKGWIDQMARENPKIAIAFINRDQDPGTWKRIEKTLSKEMEKDFKEMTAIDHQVTEDRVAITAAVKGASTKASAEPPPKFGGMSNADYAKHVRETYGFDPGV